MKLLTLLLFFLLCSLLSAKDIVLNGKSDIQKQITFANANYIVKSDFDLRGKTIYIPEGSKLVFDAGSLANGTIVGTMTKLDYRGIIFKDIKIKGSWNVPTISSSMFYEATKTNVLKQVFALAHKNVRNTIHIQQGVYRVTAPASTKGALYVPSNTTVELEGNILLEANDFPGCAVLYIRDANDVVVKGAGKIIGDKNTHTGKQGEWGMGIQIIHGRNITICDLEISNCWGDCIYIGGMSSNVSISNCNLHHARRQGISVTYANKVSINKCVIHDIAGTAPEYAIDFEPNANCSVHNMTVSNTEIYNCKGGIIAGIKGVTAENSSVGVISIKNCHVHGLRTNNTFRWHNCSNIQVSDCIIDKSLKECTFKVDAKNVKYKNIRKNE